VTVIGAHTGEVNKGGITITDYTNTVVLHNTPRDISMNLHIQTEGVWKWGQFIGITLDTRVFKRLFIDLPQEIKK